MIVINGEPFIKYNLENLYPHAHEILIVEGAVEKYRHAATPDGHSLDDTVKIIKEFPDPLNKIKLIQREGFWPEKDEMSNAYMERCTGDFIWQIDVDEFYHPEDIEKVRAFLSENPDVTRVELQTINFWHGFKAVMQGASYCFGADKFRRIFKFKPGYRFVTHRPPTVVDRDGNTCCDRKVVSADEISKTLQVYMYHYSYVFEEGVKSKADYYSRMGWGGGCEKGAKWADNEWSHLINPLRIHLIDFPPSWIVPFEGEHPEVIHKMLQEIDCHENPQIEKFLSNRWQVFADAGAAICEICIKKKTAQLNRYRSAGQALTQLMLPTDRQKIAADLSIFKAAAKLIGWA